jgi:AAA family ATP:ADP antiporter
VLLLLLQATTCGSGAEFGRALQLSMLAVVVIAAIAMVLQQHITNEAAAAAAARHSRHLHRHNSSTLAAAAAGVAADTSHHSSSSSSSSAAVAAAAGGVASPAGNQHTEKQQQQQTVWDSFRVLAGSLEIRCLAVMSLAQGLCNSLMEFAWKCHMRILYPSPADFTSFLGDVATWSGVVTGALMLLSPLLFERWGWRGVANATPNMLLFGGTVFFLACIVYQHLFGAAAAAAGAAAAGPGSLVLLQGLVLFGALQYVLGKGAKFSLFKPAEEMVYITLDEEGRTRGKAAIDVVGSQVWPPGGGEREGSSSGVLPERGWCLCLCLWVYVSVGVCDG